jgi:hypothetical protein
MTNFSDPKPYISESKTLIKSNLSHSGKMKAIKDALEIIKENKRIVERAKMESISF